MSAARHLVVAARHAPARAGLRVVDLSLRDTPIVVVAEGDVPGNLQGRRRIDFFERRAPLRVGGRLDAILIEIVAHRDHAPAAEADRGFAHLRGHLALVVRAVSPPVPHHQKIEGRRREGAERRERGQCRRGSNRSQYFAAVQQDVMHRSPTRWFCDFNAPSPAYCDAHIARVFRLGSGTNAAASGPKYSAEGKRHANLR